MSTKTTNYNLVKPADNETADILVINGNMDILDTKLKEVENKASNITVPVTSVNGETGDVVLSAADIKANDGMSVESHLANMTAHIEDTTKHITSTERTTWNSKQSAIKIKTGSDFTTVDLANGEIGIVY